MSASVPDMGHMLGCDRRLVNDSDPRKSQFTGEELQVKFLSDSEENSLSENAGRPVGTRTPDLYRVKGP